MATKLNLHKLLGADQGYLDEIAVKVLDRRELASRGANGPQRRRNVALGLDVNGDVRR